MKLCTRCGVTKDESSFAKNRNKCKKCRYEEAKQRHEHICMCCGAVFTSENKTTKYCSVECRAAGRISKIDVKCAWCDNQLFITQYQNKQFQHHYCDRNCQSKHRSYEYSGSKSPKYRRVLIICKCCGVNFEVIPYYADIKKYCSVECSRQHMLGVNHPRYNPNLTDSERFQNRDYPQYNEWRLKVFERDTFKCQKCCDNSGGNLVAHHILNYAEYTELRVEVDNGITLCDYCHKDFHDKYGYRNNTREQLNDFLGWEMPIPSEADLETVGTCRD